MVHLRKLDLSRTNITGDSRSFKTLMQNLFQLEELQLWACPIGNQGAIAGALYSTHSRLRILNLSWCDLVDDDLNGIGALKNTLEVLHLRENKNLTSEGLVHCKDLVKLKVLNLRDCSCIDDLSPLKSCLSLQDLDVSYCHKLKDDSFKVFSEESNSFPNLRISSLWNCRKLDKLKILHLNCCHKINDLSLLKDSSNLEELDITGCNGLTDDSFKVFSENPNSFPNLRVLCISDCTKLTEKVLEHLSNNNHLVYQLKDLNVGGMSKMGRILASSTSARNNLCHLKGLRKPEGIGYELSESTEGELRRSLKNLEHMS